MISMMFYPLHRQARGEGAVTDAECTDMLNYLRYMHAVYDEQRAPANAIGNIAHAKQDREEYDRAPHPEWEPKR